MNLRKREREKKTNKQTKKREDTFSRPANFSRAFHFRVFPTLTIWEPGTGYRHVGKLVSEKILQKRRLDVEKNNNYALFYLDSLRFVLRQQRS